MIATTTKFSVYVARHANARPNDDYSWALYADYPNSSEARDAVRRALTQDGYKSAKLITMSIFGA